LYTSLIRLLVLQGFYNAYAGITLPNAAGVGLHEAARPSPPIDLPALAGLAELETALKLGLPYLPQTVEGSTDRDLAELGSSFTSRGSNR